jgi:hypothetical protein
VWLSLLPPSHRYLLLSFLLTYLLNLFQWSLVKRSSDASQALQETFIIIYFRGPWSMDKVELVCIECSSVNTSGNCLGLLQRGYISSLFSSSPGNLKWSPDFRFWYRDFVYTSHLHARYMLCQFSLLYHPNNIRSKDAHMLYSPYSLSYVQIFSSVPCSQTPSVYISLYEIIFCVITIALRKS